MTIPAPIEDFLGCRTPETWVRMAKQRLPELLLDHANCEKKAASTALSLMFRYPQHDKLATRLSKLAREELRHFEQVSRLIRARGIRHARAPVSGYAAGLREACRNNEPGRLVDTLITGALIEARSCERFALLAPQLPADVAALYRGLLASEQRHFEVYLSLAREFDARIDNRVAELVAVEAKLASGPDTVFAFHSGPPA